MRASSPPQYPRHGSAPGGDGTPVLCGARLADGRTVDVRLGDGRILAVGTAGSLAGEAGGCGARVDLDGYLLLPAPVEAHAHLDTALTGAGGSGTSGGSGGVGGAGGPGGAGDAGSGSGVAGASEAAVADVQRRAVEAALLQLGHGATAVRTHVRIGGAAGLGNLRAVLAARAALRGLADVAAVAAAPVLTGVAGARGRSLLRDAVAMGATAVGGCPDLDPDPVGYTDAVLRVAAEYGCAVDLHCDGADPARLDRVAAVAAELRSAVAVGPCGGLARMPYETAAGVAERLAGAGVAVVCLPQGDCGAARGAGARPLAYAPVRLLRAAGVRVAAGSGAVRDAANPVGRGDPLQSAYLLASAGEADPAAAYATVAGQARAVLGLPEVRVAAGYPAELLAVRGDSVAGALSLGYSRIVIHRGRVVARTSAVREYCDSGAADLALPRQGLRPTAG
ncbi:amidohydrolase family protein [Streptomyces sp. WMMC500]|uniref:amidohydrolase family protein n=1 Tax=Streptomyces sp. WMMC500 TaxID=3015154 RepID=UPI00248B9C56|nr:amidohydrolase family protein [Streptomyces sp. WMMC500]WBB63820.1 amidohydrolase family protein [Streptomyces sp. WMMC500]